MKATTIHAPFDIRLVEVDDPDDPRPDRRHGADHRLVHLRLRPVALPRREPRSPQGPRIGHEFVGIVEETGSEVSTVRPGDFVIAPFMYSDNTCPHCRAGIQSACAHGGFWGGQDRDGRPVDGGQGEYARVPLADGTLVATPEVPDDALVPSLLALSDVMGTGWHAAVAAGVKQGDTVVVVGDGAVGLSGRARRVADGRRAGGRHVAARVAPADRARSSAPPTSSPSAARRVRPRSASSPAASAPTRCWSASAPGSR